VGLDFGTSCTKIMHSQADRKLTQAIIFNHGLEPTYPCFCLPTIAAFNEGRELLLGIEAAKILENKPWDYGLRLFKVVVAGNHEPHFRDNAAEQAFNNYVGEHFSSHDDGLPEKITAIYLAYAMKLAQEKIHQIPEYRNHNINFTFNICVPIDHIENNKIERDVSYGEKDPKSFYRIDPEARVFAVPESIAGVASYLRSLQRRQGIHALIDIGAGTTDVSIINLILPNDAHPELIPLWFAAGNIPIGTSKIERLISNHFAYEQNINAKDILRLLQCITAGSLSDEQLIRDIIQILNELRRETYDVWRNAYRHLMQQSAWNGVPVFVSGGGAEFPFIKNILSLPWWPNIEERFSVRDLPIPEDYDSKNGQAPFKRMAIAYGLTTPLPKLGKFVLPADAPDQTPPPLPVRDWFEPWW